MKWQIKRTQTSGSELRFFKKVSLAGVLLLVFLTVIYAFASTVYTEDRPLFRIAVILALMGIYLGSDYSGFIRKNYHYLFYLVISSYIVGGIYVLYINEFPLFEIGSTVFVALFLGILFKGRLELALYLCVVLTSFFGFYYISEQQPVPFHFFSFVIFALCAFSFITYSGRIRMMDQLKEEKDKSRQKERQFKYIFDHSPHGIILYSRDFTLRRVNSAMQQILGLPRQADGFFPLLEYIHPDDLMSGEEMEEMILNSHPVPAKLEQRFFRQDGSIIWMNISLCSISDIDWGDIQYMAILEDVTEKKKMQIQLEEAANELRNHNQALSEFTHVISHDLQEPLRMIRSYSHLIKRKYISQIQDERAAMDFGYVIEGADHMSKLIKDMLAYSRVSAKPFELEPVDTLQLTHKVLQHLSVQLQETEAAVYCNNMPTLMCNQTLLGQVLQNIISNGIKYNRPEEKPMIQISVKALPDQYQFVVQDNGQGFEDNQRERIFGIFQRLHSRHSEYQGTGIGLAICKRIIERQGGTIWAESEVGVGSTFYFTLPNRMNLS